MNWLKLDGMDKIYRARLIQNELDNLDWNNIVGEPEVILMAVKYHTKCWHQYNDHVKNLDSNFGSKKMERSSHFYESEI